MTTRQRMAPLRYDPSEIDRKWQQRWADDNLYQVNDDDPRPRWYALTMYPYPSGDLHIGHWYAMAPSDAHARFMRMRGYNVLHPMGFDAFGLPAENAAINRGIHPSIWTMENIEAHALPTPLHGRGLRLGPGDRHLPAGLLRLEPVVLPQDVRAGPRLPRLRPRQLVPHLPDRPRQRAGRGRQVRAHRGRRHPPRDGPVVLPHHRLRRRTAGLLRRRRLARAHQDDADQLDRP